MDISYVQYNDSGLASSVSCGISIWANDIQVFCQVVNSLLIVMYVSSAIVQVFDLYSCAACPGGCGMNILLLVILSF